jgi:hypothetical protein
MHWFGHEDYEIVNTDALSSSQLCLVSEQRLAHLPAVSLSVRNMTALEQQARELE